MTELGPWKPLKAGTALCDCGLPAVVFRSRRVGPPTWIDFELRCEPCALSETLSPLTPPRVTGDNQALATDRRPPTTSED